MANTWKEMLTSDEAKTLQNLDNQIAILKHQRYRIQNAATKRVSDAKKARIKAKKSAKSKSKPRNRNKSRGGASAAAEGRTPQPAEG
jgi:hypothetical protein